MKWGGCLAIYGAGYTGREVYRWLKNNCVPVKNFFVTDISKSDRQIDGIPVIQFNESSIDDGTRVIIAIKHPWNKDVEDRLDGLGIHIYRIEEENNFDKKPKHIEITTQIGCSINCKYCPQNLLIRRYHSNVRKMSFESFVKMIDKLPKDIAIVFSGFSEPFLNDEAVDMMIYVSDCGREMYLNTTLVGLTKEKFRKISKLHFRRNILHLPDKDHNANIPLNDKYYELLDLALDTRKNNDGIESSFFDSANCQGEVLEDVFKFIRGRIHVFSALSDRAGNLTMNDSVLNKTENIHGNIYCYASPHFHNHVLLPNGDIVLCCMDFGHRHILGNLLEQYYEEIQDGTEMQAIKDALSGDGDALCRHCTEAKIRTFIP